jgi:hypothetical protein
MIRRGAHPLVAAIWLRMPAHGIASIPSCLDSTKIGMIVLRPQFLVSFLLFEFLVLDPTL